LSRRINHIPFALSAEIRFSRAAPTGCRRPASLLSPEVLSMASLEFNKMAAAVLTAGIIASLSGFIAREVVHAKKPAQHAYVPAGVEAAAPADKGGGAGPEPIAGLLANANPQAGQEVAKKCAACHSFEKGSANKVGPNLFGVVGAKHGHAEGFPYSPAITGKQGPWDPEALNQFLFKPQAYAKGTKMTFAGLPKAEDRANIIAYLQSLK
jgi:cytochrome c